MEHFVKIINEWKPLNIITKSSVLDVATVLDLPMPPFVIFIGWDFSRNTQMVKYTQTIRRQITDELFECVWPVLGVGA